jgi:tetratricopeptide (TPR) repeat protein
MNVAQAMEQHEEALAQAHQAQDLEPLSSINAWVGLRHYFAGRYTMPVEEYVEVLTLDPDFAPAHWHLGWAYGQLGRHDAVIASADQADNPIYLASLGHANTRAGNG